jgi:benzoate membrane transport protein
LPETAPSRPVGAIAQPALAGLIASFVGFASTFAIVLAGLRNVGATPGQAASGLLAVCVVMGLTTIGLSRSARMPILLAWSTPGAALLAGAGPVAGGYPAAVGAFIACGALLALTGLWAGLGELLARIPLPLASAMLAGVLLPLCLAPVEAVVRIPAAAAPVIIVWAVVGVVARRWAVPAALAVAVLIVLISEPLQSGPTGARPMLEAVVPAFTPGALIGLAVPLFIVTMASQNVPGMSVLAANGYRPKLRPVLLSTGGATMIGAPFGVFAINLAAITAALTAGPDAGADPGRRWLAAAAAGASYVVLGLGAGLAAALVASAPTGLIEAVAGLALLGTLSSALTAALADQPLRESALVTFVVSASGITALGISAAFWGLVAGLALLALQRARPGRLGPTP